MSLSSHDHGNCELCDEIEQRVRALEGAITWALDRLALLARDNAVANPVANIAGALQAALTPPPAEEGEHAS